MEIMDKLIEYFGSQKALIEALSKHTDQNIKHGHLYYWKTKGLPPKRAVQIEKLTNGLFTRRSLCPEFFD